MSDISVYVGSCIGKRSFNEDSHGYAMNINGENKKQCSVNMFVICDGHSSVNEGKGKTISKMVVKNLIDAFMKKDMVYPASEDVVDGIFAKIQKDLVKDFPDLVDDSGTTALIVIIFEKNGAHYIQTINLGDCRAVMYSEGITIPLSVDHKPEWPMENKRLRSMIGNGKKDVLKRDTDGILRIGDFSVSRSFGDLDGEPYISYIPEMTLRKIKPTDEFIVMACDGLWDVMENHEAAHYVSNTIGKDDVNVSLQLARMAITNMRSDDNVTVITLGLSR